jgi:plastocyanin
MTKLLMIPLALLATLVVVAAAAADTKTVQITRSGFTPKTTSAQLGDTVAWHNADTADHQVVADDGSFASPVLKSGQSFSYTFTKNGTFAYHDALASTHKGTVTVTGTPASVTLTAASSTVVYGEGTTLSGAVSNQITNEPVALTSQPYGKGTQAVGTTMTQANGTFSFPVSPTIGTTYQAQWRTGTSPTVKVDVAPRVGFGHSGTLYTAKVTSDLTYAGRFVWVQRQGAYGWTNVKRIYLSSTSRASFHLLLRKGRSVLRLDLPLTQAGPGYVASTSRMLAIVKR